MAGEDPRANLGFLFLDTRPDARSASFGPMVAVPNGWSAFHNPAGIAFTPNAGASFSMGDFADGLNSKYWVIGTGYSKFGSIAVNNYRYNYRKVELTTEAEPEGTGEFITPYQNSFSVSYAYAWSGWMSVGITHKWLRDDFGILSTKGQYNDLGIMARLPIALINKRGYHHEVSAGFSSINNLSGKKPSYKTPSLVTVNQFVDTLFLPETEFSYDAPKFDCWAFAYTFSFKSDAWRFTVFKSIMQLVYKDSDARRDEMRIGTEWTFFDMLTLRTQSKNFEKAKNSLTKNKEDFFGSAYGLAIALPLKALSLTRWDITPRFEWTRGEETNSQKTYTYWAFGIHANFWNTK